VNFSGLLIWISWCAVLLPIVRRKSSVVLAAEASMDAHVVRQIETHIPSLQGYARRLVNDPDLAHDMVQDCLERALSRRHLYRQDTNLRGWLFTILLNVVRSHGRKAQRRQWAPIDDHVEGLHSASRQIDALHLRDLGRAFARLPDPLQEVIVLVGVEGMAYAEAARLLEVPVGTVRSRLSRARRQLKGLMDRTEPRPHDVRHGASYPPREVSTIAGGPAAPPTPARGPSATAGSFLRLV
jgi:RNA polymerase sigma-70 factor (ECF subfamily)